MAVSQSSLKCLRRKGLDVSASMKTPVYSQGISFPSARRGPALAAPGLSEPAAKDRQKTI